MGNKKQDCELELNPQQQPRITEDIIKVLSPWEHIMLTALKGLSYLGLARQRLQEQVSKIADKKEEKIVK